MGVSSTILRSRAARRVGVVAAAVAVGATAIAPAGAQSALDTDGKPVVDVAEARGEVEGILAAAQTAADEFARARQDYTAAEAEISRIEARIPDLLARVERLETAVRERAVDAYVGYGARVASILDVESPIEAGRQAHIIDTVNGHDHDVAAQLTDAKRRLTERQGELEVEQERLQAVLDDYERTRVELYGLLAEADEALRKAKVLEVWEASVQRRPADLTDPHPPADAPASEGPVSTPDASDGPDSEPVITSASRCPIDAPVFFTNDWGAPRSGGRTHQGTDVFADPLTPNVAVDDGRLAENSGGLGGTALALTAPDGTRYYYGHLAHIEPGVVGTTVKAGDVIGYTGATGNASPTAPHTHFQMHPDGGAPVNPYYTLFVLCSDNFELRT